MTGGGVINSGGSFIPLTAVIAERFSVRHETVWVCWALVVLVWACVFCRIDGALIYSSDKIGNIEQNKRRCRIVAAVSIRSTHTRVRIIPDNGHQASLKPF